MRAQFLSSPAFHSLTLFLSFSLSLLPSPFPDAKGPAVGVELYSPVSVARETVMASSTALQGIHYEVI